METAVAFNDYDMDYEERYEIIEGVKTIMAPSPTCEHNTVDTNLIIIFGNYCRKNKCGRVFGDNIDVHLPDGNLVMPDLSVVCDRSILKEEGTIYGVPDLIVEILSRSTAKRDIGIKKAIYERNGVKEYWIVNRWAKTVEVYLLKDGKFDLDYIYQVYKPIELERITEQERSGLKFEIKVSIFEDLLVDVHDIFYDV